MKGKITQVYAGLFAVSSEWHPALPQQIPLI